MRYWLSGGSAAFRREIKGELRLDHFEGCAWRGFRHHVALSAVAHGFLALRRALSPTALRSGLPSPRTFEKKFTLTQLQPLYEIVLGQEMDKRNFRKRVLSMGLLEELDEVEQDVAHRAARLYRFDDRKYKKLTKDGFEFSL